MNGYIINPSWFYWIGVADCIKGIAIGLLVFSALALLIATANWTMQIDEEDAKWSKTVVKIVTPVLLVALLIIVFIPSKTTLISMQVAKFATYENAEWSVEAVKSAVEYIIEAIKAVK